MNKKYYPTVDYIKECLRYEDGKLFWLVRPREHFQSDQGWKMWNKRYAGKEAGSVSNVGGKKEENLRWSLVIDYNRYYRSKLVWIFHGREIPEKPLEIDHEDTNNLNDKIENLRVATRSQQEGNKGANRTNTTGIKGVWFNKQRNKYVAEIKINQKKTSKHFDTIEEARAARIEMAQSYYGEFFRE
jgi:hypothetical protein